MQIEPRLAPTAHPNVLYAYSHIHYYSVRDTRLSHGSYKNADLSGVMQSTRALRYPQD